jgi:hypothetical protein
MVRSVLAPNGEATLPTTPIGLVNVHKYGIVKNMHPKKENGTEMAIHSGCKESNQ